MTHFHPARLFRFVLGAALLAAASVASAAGAVTARFQPETIVLGQNSVLVVEIEDARQAARADLPNVDGLRLSFAGQGSNTQFTMDASGQRMRRTLALQFVAQPSRAGTFVVPAFAVEVDGEPVRVPETTLIVLAPAGAAADASMEDLISLEVILPERPIWVGEDLPVTLRLKVDGSITLREIRRYGADAESFGSVRQAGEATRSIETGPPAKRVFEIPVRLVPLKSGRLRLSFSLESVLEFPRRQRGLDPFDPFGLPSLLRDGEQRVIESRPLELDVRPLPTPEPPGFSGGVGRPLVATVAADATEVRVGEPLTLTVNVSGEGNFDRLQAPPFPNDGRWRSYDPTAEFTAADPTNVRGSKAFKLVLIPLDPSITATPAIPFASFDPVAGRYVTQVLQPVPLKVIPSASGQAPRATTTPRATPATAAPGPESSPRALLPDPPQEGPWFPSITPDFLAPSTLARLGWPFGAVGLLALALLVARALGDPRRRARAARRKTFAEAMTPARAAAEAGDGRAMVDAGFRLLALAAADGDARRAASLTANEIEAWLRGVELAEPRRAALRRLLAQADLLRYGGVAEPAAGRGLGEELAALQDIERMALAGGSR